MISIVICTESSRREMLNVQLLGVDKSKKDKVIASSTVNGMVEDTLHGK